MSGKPRGIYEPAGRAFEFAELALSIWPGCPHGCDYCFMSTRPRSQFKSPEEMQRAVTAPEGVLEVVRRHLPRYSGTSRRVLIQFTGDAYPPAEADVGVTREVLAELRGSQVPFDVLTKAGGRAIRDFDLYADGAGRFAQTVITLNERWRREHEPGASKIGERYHTFAIAKHRGIETWCSLEPIIDPQGALGVLRTFGKVVDAWKIGKINEDPREKGVDWAAFGEVLAGHIRDCGIRRYYIKSSLERFMPHGFPLSTLDGER